MLIYQKHFTASTGDLTVPLFLQSWSSIVILPNCTQTTYNVWPNYHWVKVQHRVKTESSNFDTFSSQEEVSCSKAVPFLNRSRFKICPQNIRNCFLSNLKQFTSSIGRTDDRTNERTRLNCWNKDTLTKQKGLEHIRANIRTIWPTHWVGSWSYFTFEIELFLISFTYLYVICLKMGEQ